MTSPTLRGCQLQILKIFIKCSLGFLLKPKWQIDCNIHARSDTLTILTIYHVAVMRQVLHTTTYSEIVEQRIHKSCGLLTPQRTVIKIWKSISGVIQQLFLKYGRLYLLNGAAPKKYCIVTTRQAAGDRISVSDCVSVI